MVVAMALGDSIFPVCELLLAECTLGMGRRFAMRDDLHVCGQPFFARCCGWTNGRWFIPLFLFHLSDLSQVVRNGFRAPTV